MTDFFLRSLKLRFRLFLVGTIMTFTEGRLLALGGWDDSIMVSYGLTFDDSCGAWSEQEKNTIALWLSALPIELASVNIKASPKRVPLIKTNNCFYISNLLGYHTNWTLTTSLIFETEKVSRLDFKKQLIYHLMQNYDSIHKLSQKAAWLEISGWRPYELLGLALPWPQKPALNQDPRGFAAPRGMGDPKEDFLTFGVRYFTESSASESEEDICLDSRKRQFFREAFPSYRAGDDIERACRQREGQLLSDLQFMDPFFKEILDLGPINESTVQGFEILYATPGVSDIAEVAGHLLLRIKLNNNNLSNQLGVENPLDLVVAFLADTQQDSPRQSLSPAPPAEVSCQEESWFDLGRHRTDFDPLQATLQALKGLSGGFLTTFDRATLYETIKSYTQIQDRNLLRYELLLSPEQKRRLIKHLHWVKHHFRSKYYFFDRNCASVLFQVIGEGIGDEEIARFDPIVSPPNTLVALLVRRKLAREVHPAFYSYKRRGQMAQEVMVAKLNHLRARYPKAAWPTPQELLSTSDRERQGAYEKLHTLANQMPELHPRIYEMGNLGQEAELVFANHEKNCEDYTSSSLATTRNLQNTILRHTKRLCGSDGCPTVERLATSQFVADERAQSFLGSQHTGLYTVAASLGIDHRTSSKTNPVLSMEGILYRQNMGSPSRFAMQRAGSVTLGGFNLLLEENKGKTILAEWQATGMILRKFKERLDTVPPYMNAYGQLGLGLKVLQLRWTPNPQHRETTYVGGELLANLLGTKTYDKYLYLSLGVDVGDGRQPSFHQNDGATFGLAIPARLEGLWTFDHNRIAQLRASYEIRYQRLRHQDIIRQTARGAFAYRAIENPDYSLQIVASILHESQRGLPAEDFALYLLGVQVEGW